MVEIKYGDQHEVTDLAGQTVSEAREHFKSEFGIPDKAKAKLNGSKVKTGAELDTVLNDDDKLTFAVSRGRGAYLIGALILALAVTGSVFAATATSDTATLGIVAQDDFVTVAENMTDNVTGNTWNIFGKYKGTLPAGNLFDITPATGYPGDLVATVSIGNGDDMVKVYRVYVMQLEAEDSLGASCSTGILTLSKGEVELAIDTSGKTAPYYVRSNGGFYVSHGWSGFWTPGDGSEDPLLYCEVVQR